MVQSKGDSWVTSENVTALWKLLCHGGGILKIRTGTFFSFYVLLLPKMISVLTLCTLKVMETGFLYCSKASKWEAAVDSELLLKMPMRMFSVYCMVIQWLNDIFICMGYYNRLPQTGWLINARNLFLTVLEAGRSKMAVLAIYFSVWFRDNAVLFCCILTWWKGWGSFPGSFLEGHWTHLWGFPLMTTSQRGIRL